jgi:hypothetical protein
MPRALQRPPRSLSVAVFLAVTWLLAGCGGNYQISGTVTYKGKPVPVGSVYFMPDEGRSGRSVNATIENGKYCTPPGEGAAGGLMVVQVVGFDGKLVRSKEGDLAASGKRLFPAYVTKVQLPARDNVLDIEVPEQ